ncbi:MAG: hypothetical protein QOI24_3166 [Acidobacteriota bacterium]|nr:hypothetical protein [Acidobacteriota bacterium]
MLAKIKIATIFALLLAATSAFGAARSLDVVLLFDERTILPATPTGMTVIVTNRGDKPARLPQSLWLVATNDAGVTFTVRANNFSRETAAHILDDEATVIDAGATREIRFDPSIAMIGSPWLMDQKLWTPGRYQLRAVFAEDVSPDGTFDAKAAVASKPETLTVAVTSKDDQAVWEWMKARNWNENAWMSRSPELIDFIEKQHPQSTYALFTAVYLPKSDEDPAPLAAALVKRFPAHSFTEQVKFLLLQYYQDRTTLANLRNDPYRAANEADEARAIASELAQSARSAAVRTDARHRLEQVPSREQLTHKEGTH